MLIWIHHISKPGGMPNGREKSEEQNKYSGLGSSEIQNACREVIVLSKQDGDVFELAFTKRGRRLGKRDKDGRPITKFNIKHHDNGIVWVACEGFAATASRKQVEAIGQIKKVQNFVRSEKMVTQDQIKALTAQERQAFDAFFLKVHQGDEANFRPEGSYDEDVSKGNFWGPERTLKAEWIVWLCKDTDAVSMIQNTGIPRITGKRRK